MKTTLCALIFAVGLAEAGLKDDLGLVSGDVIAIGGDSITDGGGTPFNGIMYGDYLRTWFQLSYPELNLNTHVMARSGSSLAMWYGGAPPLTAPTSSLYERYMVPFDPDVVLLAHGSNGGQAAPAHIARYEDLWDDWINNGDRRLVMVGMAAESGTKHEVAKGNAEAGFAATNPRLFSANNYPFWGQDYLANGANGLGPIDFHMIGTLPFDGDGINHPGQPMQIVYAWAILKSLGAETLVSNATINAASASVVSSNQCSITNLTGNAGGLVFDRLDARLPWAVDKEGLETARGFRPEIVNWQDYSIKVQSLAPGEYVLKCEGVEIWRGAHTLLAAGVNMASFTAGPVWDQTQEVLHRCRDLSGYDRTTGVKIASNVNQGTYGDYLDGSLGFYQNGTHRGASYTSKMTPYITALAPKMAAIHASAEPVTRRYTVSASGLIPPPSPSGLRTVED